jgi:DNA-binding FadR family transcriptional regulator
MTGLVKASQKQQKKPILTPILPGPTRWTSHYLALERLNELRADIELLYAHHAATQNPAEKWMDMGDAKAKEKARNVERLVRGPDSAVFWHNLIKYAHQYCRKSYR